MTGNNLWTIGDDSAVRSPVVDLFFVDSLLEALAELGEWLVISGHFRLCEMFLLYSSPLGLELLLFPAATHILVRHGVQLGDALALTRVLLVVDAARLVLRPRAIHGLLERIRIFVHVASADNVSVWHAILHVMVNIFAEYAGDKPRRLSIGRLERAPSLLTVRVQLQLELLAGWPALKRATDALTIPPEKTVAQITAFARDPTELTRIRSVSLRLLITAVPHNRALTGKAERA